MKCKFLTICVLSFFMIILIMGVIAQAQQAGGETQEKKVAEKTFFDLLAAGGLVGWLIIAISIVGVALAIMYIVEIQKDKLCPPEVVGEIESLFEEGNLDDVIQLCDTNKTYLTNVIGAAVSRVDAGYEEMLKAYDNVSAEETFKLNAKISYLSLLGNIAPMMGLLGTVTGMISSFTVIEQQESPSPAQLAKGVYEALITTAEGLFVAIPILTIFFFMKNKVTKLSIEVDLLGRELIERFRDVNK